ncbi:hypothetical protein A3A84_03215 [Candidatus Collierbacteria bacterium RIFCSPLOWO2_01_FULL_50_23]|uniref:VIT family protein n=2 Tax=Candidatus Collieribacteriota TaxID=1752725 RepID=A0A1F5EWK7_9BACT|nr:MAG: hypothetical protein A3D09_03115 [Candidatus Collierbacteria bacterium RIFCSPHIGHO2_02_FULL_49_10]OGD71940.1 MAG: hypothetical protein A2703_00970 [Candidatus Collierbacteria bacterium RIFCSPHIGHO2_01_FULL_50_25]OGD74804.1 MAG: hypothetical protein A3A84_03215 [Candidatus Collierbacteria bacterium RIFCSPLOWO2_01_FULL_50_23]
MRNQFPVRETIFGLEDSIVSTLGVVVGIAAGTDSRYIVLLSAIVVVVVESLSMGAGTYLSNKSQMEIERAQGKSGFLRDRKIVAKSVTDSVFMAVSYILGGLTSVLPFFFLSPRDAIIPSVLISVLTLFYVGFAKGKMARINPFKSGLEMSTISLTAAGLGFVVGKLASVYLMKP